MNDKLKTIMMKFSTTDLRAFLGEKLIEQYQLEWSESKALTKGLLCDMILKLNGIAILNNSDFRRKIISHMDRVDIEHLFSYVPISKRKGITDDYQKAEVIFNSPWKESELTSEFLNSLGIQEKFFNDDNLPENFQYSERGETMYDNIDALENCNSDTEDAAAEIENGNMEQALRLLRSAISYADDVQ